MQLSMFDNEKNLSRFDILLSMQYHRDQLIGSSYIIFMKYMLDNGPRLTYTQLLTFVLLQGNCEFHGCDLVCTRLVAFLFPSP